MLSPVLPFLRVLLLSTCNIGVSWTFGRRHAGVLKGPQRHSGCSGGERAAEVTTARTRSSAGARPGVDGQWQRGNVMFNGFAQTDRKERDLHLACWERPYLSLHRRAVIRVSLGILRVSLRRQRFGGKPGPASGGHGPGVGCDVSWLCIQSTRPGGDGANSDPHRITVRRAVGKRKLANERLTSTEELTAPSR